MKRITIAVVLLIVSIGLCVCEIKTINMSVDVYSDNLNAISDLIDESRLEDAAMLSADTISNWKKTSAKLDKYLYHDYVDGITLSMVNLPVYIKSGSIEAANTAIQSIKIQLASLKESELPYIHNIL